MHVGLDFEGDGGNTLKLIFHSQISPLSGELSYKAIISAYWFIVNSRTMILQNCSLTRCLQMHVMQSYYLILLVDKTLGRRMLADTPCVCRGIIPLYSGFSVLKLSRSALLYYLPDKCWAKSMTSFRTGCIGSWFIWLTRPKSLRRDVTSHPPPCKHLLSACYCCLHSPALLCSLKCRTTNYLFRFHPNWKIQYMPGGGRIVEKKEIKT